MGRINRPTHSYEEEAVTGVGAGTRKKTASAWRQLRATGWEGSSFAPSSRESRETCGVLCSREIARESLRLQRPPGCPVRGPACPRKRTSLRLDRRTRRCRFPPPGGRRGVRASCSRRRGASEHRGAPSTRRCNPPRSSDARPNVLRIYTNDAVERSTSLPVLIPPRLTPKHAQMQPHVVQVHLPRKNNVFWSSGCGQPCTREGLTAAVSALNADISSGQIAHRFHALRRRRGHPGVIAPRFESCVRFGTAREAPVS